MTCRPGRRTIGWNTIPPLGGSLLGQLRKLASDAPGLFHQGKTYRNKLDVWIKERLEVTAEELGRIVLIAPRTLARRKSEGRLLAEESDRLLRAARILGRAIELFEGDEAAARRWLKTKNRALGDHEPLEVARTDVGAREVETLIGRLEHGVVS